MATVEPVSSRAYADPEIWAGGTEDQTEITVTSELVGHGLDVASARSAAELQSGYVYGFEGLFESRSGPVSSDELLIWLKQHSQGINEELRDRMLTADIRNKLVEDLSHLRAQVTDSTDGVAHEAVRTEAEQLMAAYQGTPFEEQARVAIDKIVNDKDDQFGKTEAEKIQGEMQSVIDGLGKDDQMEMIYIQNLTQRLNEQFGFGSAYLSKAHDTLMAIIGNLA